MGAVSSNISSEIVKSLVQVTNTAAQGCVFQADQVQNVTISGASGGTFIINEDWQQNLNLNSECLQSVNFQTSTKQAIQEEIKQLAKSIAQQFGLSAAESYNLAREVAQISTQVTNSYLQNCVNSEAQIQNFELVNATNVTGYVYQNWDQYNTSTISCIMQDQAVTDTSQQISLTTEQTAEATVQNFLAGILAAIFGILAVIGLIFFGLVFFGFIFLKGGGGGATKVTLQQPPPDI